MNLKKVLAKLEGKEALIIQLYFVEELNVYEIAEVMNVSTGRVSQIKTSAIKRLREKSSKRLLNYYAKIRNVNKNCRCTL